MLSPALISIGRLKAISVGLISRIELIGLIGRPARGNLHCFTATCPLLNSASCLRVKIALVPVLNLFRTMRKSKLPATRTAVTFCMSLHPVYTGRLHAVKHSYFVMRA